MRRKISLVLFLIGVAAVVCRADVVQLTETNLYDLFPQQNQGENGIYLQYRSADGSYTDLVNLQDYCFGTLGTNWNLPLIKRSSHYPDSIHAHPTAVNAQGYDRDAIIRIVLNGNYGYVRVVGSTQTASSGDVRYYIYKGAENYNQPIWQQWGNGSFDLLIAYTEGEELFFATDAGETDHYDWANWRSVRFQAVPEPTTIGLAGIYLGLLMFRRSSQKRF